MPLDKWQKVIDVNLTGAFLFSQAAGARDAQAPIRPHHQRRVDRRAARVGQRSALRGVRGEQSRAHGTDARAGGVMGPRRAFASTRSRRASSTRGSPDPVMPLAEPSHQGDMSDSARRRGRRTQGRRRVSRRRRVELHHRPGDRRRWRTNDWRQCYLQVPQVLECSMRWRRNERPPTRPAVAEALRLLGAAAR